MRDDFLEELLACAQSDPHVFLIVGDLGFGVIDDFATLLPKQFLNTGVSEQNALGVASGIALEGYTVFVYSIANFPSLRALEQLRNDICYHGRNVNIVSIGAGMSYGPLGYSHFAVEDLSAVRALPGIQVLSPGNGREAKVTVHEAIRNPGPSYIRLGKEKRDSPDFPLHVDLSRGQVLYSGDSVVLLGLGELVNECLAARASLNGLGLSVGVVHLPVIKPMDFTWLDAIQPEVLVVIVEEHVLEGGFGSAILEGMADKGWSGRVVRRGIPPEALAAVGDQEYLRKISGIDRDAIVTFVLEALAARAPGSL